MHFSLAHEMRAFDRMKLVEPGYAPTTQFSANTDIPVKDLVPETYAALARPIFEAFSNKVHSVRTLALVAKDLGEDADWLGDIALDMEPEDGLIWVYDPEHPDGTMAFSQFGIESLCNLIDIHRSTTK